MSASPPDDLDAIAEKILRFQLRELDDLRMDKQTMPRKISSRNRHKMAESLKIEIKVTRTFISDRRMAKSIAEAVQLDGQTIVEVVVEENIALQEYVHAEQLQGREVTLAIHPLLEMIDTEKLSKLAGRYMPHGAGEEFLKTSTLASQSSLAHRNSGKISKIQCTACNDWAPYFDVINVPCRHPYCQDCLQHLFCTSYVDESLFPPRCCRQQITPASIDIFLTRQMITDYNEKRVEFSTLNRTYCSDPSCAKFIPPDHIRHDVATCRTCSKQTCVLCKAARHLNQDCPQDPAMQQLINVANENHWQQCYSCRRIVELTQGCYHITCLCGAEFCYLCRKEWKTCACAQWNEELLLERAGEVVARNRGDMPIADRAQDLEVQQMAEVLREQHNCDHARWGTRGGRWDCENCSEPRYRYIYECRQCKILACKDCRYHRLWSF